MAIGVNDRKRLNAKLTLNFPPHPLCVIKRKFHHQDKITTQKIRQVIQKVNQNSVTKFKSLPTSAGI